jgi:hypothetical protein
VPVITCPEAMAEVSRPVEEENPYGRFGSLLYERPQ